MPAALDSQAGTFHHTRWSLIVRATATTEPSAHLALEELCRLYWPPLYCFARRRGLLPADAEDATQSFFADILAAGTLGTANPERGRLRTFLMGAFQRHLIDLLRAQTAQRRGGRTQPIPLDQAVGEDALHREPADPRSPEQEFHRQWALTTLESAVQRLGAESEDDPKQFQALRPFLAAGEGQEPAYGAVAAEVGMTEGALRVAVHRLRKRFRDHLFAVIAETLESPTESNIRAEVRALLEALA